MNEREKDVKHAGITTLVKPYSNGWRPLSWGHVDRLKFPRHISNTSVGFLTDWGK